MAVVGILEPISAGIVTFESYLDTLPNPSSITIAIVLAIVIGFLMLRLWFLGILVIGVKKLYGLKTKEAFLAITSFGLLVFFIISVIVPVYFTKKHSNKPANKEKINLVTPYIKISSIPQAENGKVTISAGEQIVIKVKTPKSLKRMAFRSDPAIKYSDFCSYGHTGTSTLTHCIFNKPRTIRIYYELYYNGHIYRSNVLKVKVVGSQ